MFLSHKIERYDFRNDLYLTSNYYYYFIKLSIHCNMLYRKDQGTYPFILKWDDRLIVRYRDYPMRPMCIVYTAYYRLETYKSMLTNTWTTWFSKCFSPGFWYRVKTKFSRKNYKKTIYRNSMLRIIRRILQNIVFCHFWASVNHDKYLDTTSKMNNINAEPNTLTLGLQQTQHNFIT